MPTISARSASAGEAMEMAARAAAAIRRIGLLPGTGEDIADPDRHGLSGERVAERLGQDDRRRRAGQGLQGRVQLVERLIGQDGDEMFGAEGRIADDERQLEGLARPVLVPLLVRAGIEELDLAVRWQVEE